MADERVMLGNEAIAWGLVESGGEVITSYPGTPSSEILPAVIEYRRELGAKVVAEWSVNEMVAFQVALGAAYAGKRSATIMKQVGLNVAADALLSSAYTGCRGGFVIVSADDPGPYSSQTEQDSRFFAMFAKVPVLDPATPAEAYAYTRLAFELSERFQIPVILRPSLRVCHSRQTIALGRETRTSQPADFKKDPNRWAATPKFRLQLHRELNEKLTAIARETAVLEAFTRFRDGDGRRGVIAGGVLRGMVEDWAASHGFRPPLLHIGVPFPIEPSLLADFTGRYDAVLVLEETAPVIEQQLADRRTVSGRLNGAVPAEGEISGEVLEGVLGRFLGLEPPAREAAALPELPPPRKPALCPGCPHRNSFHALRRAMPKAIYAGDIGCYTLGINMKAVDTVLVMGASIGLAMGLHQAYALDGQNMPVAATIGDSTFFHSGLPQLANAVYNNHRVVVVILDNFVTAMTGMQPAISAGRKADDTTGQPISIESAVRGCGVRHIRAVDPYLMPEAIQALREAYAFTQQADGGPAVVIMQHACVLNDPAAGIARKVPIEWVEEKCTRCKICVRNFNCPALVDEGKAGIRVDYRICAECGQCVNVCPSGALIARVAPEDPCNNKS